MADDLRARPGRGPVTRLLAMAGCTGLAVVLASVVWPLPETGPSLAPLVETSLADTGVSSRVTAVLLAFRGYDTLLEVTVLFVAAVAIRSMSSKSAPHPAHVRGRALHALLRLIAPLAILLAAYFVWLGSHAPGGAFQAGAVLGGAGIALALGGVAVLGAVPPTAVRALAALGPGVFVGVGVGGLLADGAFLRYPPELASLTIFAIEAVLTVSIGLALLLLLGEAWSPAAPGSQEPTGSGDTNGGGRA